MAILVVHVLYFPLSNLQLYAVGLNFLMSRKGFWCGLRLPAETTSVFCLLFLAVPSTNPLFSQVSPPLMRLQASLTQNVTELCWTALWWAG